MNKINHKDSKVGNLVKYKSNTGEIKIDIIRKKRESLAVDNDDQHADCYYVWDDEIINFYTKEEKPEYYL